MSCQTNKILPAHTLQAESHVDVVVIGAGACGLTAALAAKESVRDVIVLERDVTPSGSTALSSGMIPACNTRLQRQLGIADSAEIMAADIQRKANNAVDHAVLQTVCESSGPTIDWLMDRQQIQLQLVEGFLYPGHNQLRMHAPPSKTGAELMTQLVQAVERSAVAIVTQAHVTHLYADDGRRIHGVQVQRPDGSQEMLSCDALILACNGYGGQPMLVAKYLPEIAAALYFGHAGNQGDAVLWGQALGAELHCMGAYQGHGSVATPHGILITWALMMEGGIQVNKYGQRFANEHQGYSEQAVTVLQQADGVAWNIYDQQLHELGLTFADYQQACELGAIKQGDNIIELAENLALPAQALVNTLATIDKHSEDPFGRDFSQQRSLQAPYYGVKVTGALFHTQGGLAIDAQARVLGPEQTPLPNLFAAGGAACGLSGETVAGYLSGNGLLSAVVLGRIAGTSASRLCSNS